MSFRKKIFCSHLLMLILYNLIDGIHSEETNVTVFTTHSIQEDIAEDEEEEEKTTVDLMKQDWVSDAVLDVGYYLRNNKFNDFDRR